MTNKGFEPLNEKHINILNKNVEACTNISKLVKKQRDESTENEMDFVKAFNQVLYSCLVGIDRKLCHR